MNACPANVISDFRRSVNMSSAQIRAWAKDPRAKEASWATTRARLPALANLKAKQGGWTSADCTFAKRVLNFNSRMGGMVKKWGCTRKAVISLRNWGRQPTGCAVPAKR